MKNVFIAVIFLSCLFSGCATLESLNTVKPTKYFVLEEHHIREQTRGMFNSLWVEALLKGKYVEYAYDKHGTYFLGEQPSIVILTGDNARSFIETKEISPGPFLYGSLVGGVWIPNEGSSKKTKLFYTLRQANDGSVAGVVGMGVTRMVEGSLETFSYASESEFIESIKIKEL